MPLDAPVRRPIPRWRGLPDCDGAFGVRVLAAALVGALAVAGTALGATPIDGQFQVNTYTTESQRDPSIAVDADGNFVVVWDSDVSTLCRCSPETFRPGGLCDLDRDCFEVPPPCPPAANCDGTCDWLDEDGAVIGLCVADRDSSSQSIQSQRYDSSGGALGAQFQVNTYTQGLQYRASVAVDADGDFVVVWTSFGSFRRCAAGSAANVGGVCVNDNDCDDNPPCTIFPFEGDCRFKCGTDNLSDNVAGSVQGQRYDAGGNRVGSQFQVNSYANNTQLKPAVAADSDGNFVVVWTSLGSDGSDTSGYSIQGQRYASDGSPMGDEFQANSYTPSEQQSPSIAVDSEGNFVVVWQSNGSAGGDSSGYSIQGQRYAADGSPADSQFQVNSYTALEQLRPTVAADADGNFVVVWHSTGGEGDDDSASSVQGQHYDSSGSPIGDEFQVNTYTTDYQLDPAISIDDVGGFVITWRSDGSAGTDTSSHSVQGQRFDPSGSAVGNEFQVNTYTTAGQARPAVAVDADGDFVIAWESNTSSGICRCAAGSGANVGGLCDTDSDCDDDPPCVDSPAEGDCKDRCEWLDANGEPIGLCEEDRDTSFFSIQSQRYTGFEVVWSGLGDVAVRSGEGGTTIITGTDESGLVLVEITLPEGTSFPIGTITIGFEASGAITAIDMAGASVPVPPGKSIRILADPSSDSVCVIDAPGMALASALTSCIGGTNPSSSQVVLSCDEDGDTVVISGFPDAPTSREYTCTTSTESGQAYVTVDGLVFSFVSPVFNPKVPALRPTGLLALTALLVVGGALLLRGRLRNRR